MCFLLLVLIMALEIIYMPDVEGSGEVVEYLVELGETVEKGEPLIVVESDKASMEVPAPFSCILKSWEIELEGSVETGSALAQCEVIVSELATSDAAPFAEAQISVEPEAVAEKATTSNATPVTESIVSIDMPDAGGDGDVVEFYLQPGDHFLEGDAILLVESDKAAMEVPAPFSGTLVEYLVETGQTISEGTSLVTASVSSGIQTANDAEKSVQTSEKVKEPESSISDTPQPSPTPSPMALISSDSSKADGSVYSGPASRKLARQLGVNLVDVKGTGPRGRILKEDIKAFVKSSLKTPKQEVVSGTGIPSIPEQDFSQFGEIESKNLSGMAKATSAHMSRCWLNIPHVTLFDESDITELERYRASISPEALGIDKKPTILPFLVLVIAKALRKYPLFNSALHPDGKQVIYKNYINIGVAVDTPAGLVVPVIKDADLKSISELSETIADFASKARDRKLTAEDMQGGCFTISSLGATGGTGFTPIINAPEVAILGVAKATMKPVWDGDVFQPRKLLPLCLSFDHRVINGGDAGRFMATVNQSLSDIRHLLL